MNIDEIKKTISFFDRNAFREFFNEMLMSDELLGVKRLDSEIWASQAERFSQSEEAYFLQYYPVQAFRYLNPKTLDVTAFVNLIELYERKRIPSPWLPINGKTYYLINNFDSSIFGISDDDLLNIYQEKLSPILNMNFLSIGVGNANTFLTAEPDNFQKIERILNAFSEKHRDGICISISSDFMRVNEYITQAEFSGVSSKSLSAMQPIYKIKNTNGLLEEFNALINNDSSEHMLEEFLHENYQLIFGPQYDQISTQLWLKFPDYDIGNRDRRLDIFMRNATSEDWELFELKKANVQLHKSISDLPMITSAVTNAIAQAKNYQRLLAQDSVKKQLASEGIEYYEPEINIVIGRSQSIPIQQWRRIIADNKNGVNIKTYDELLKEAKIRFEGMKNYII